jgi:F-type H+-transporting ATPase subunit a
VGGTATSNIAVTTTLAIVSFLVIQVHSFRELGILGWLDHLTCGLTKGSKGMLLIVPLIFLVELAGVFIKPAALAIRLYANMLGGHILMATLLLFGTQAMNAGLGPLGWGSITVVSGIFAVLLTFLELFVALLQAFIFMFLTAVFISLMNHEEHDEEHADEAGHEAEAAAAH